MAEPRRGDGAQDVATGRETGVATEARIDRTPGWREVLVVAAIVVGVVLGAAVGTGLLPAAGQDLVFRTPVAIVVLVVGTVGLLASLARRPPAG